MNMLSVIQRADTMLARTEVSALVSKAARTVSPLWPLESAIAVNPLAGFEEMPFAEAVESAARRFGARQTLPLTQWRELALAGHIDDKVLQDAAICRLGGIYRAAASVAKGVSRLDLLMARLIDLDPSAQEFATCSLQPDAAFIAKWCALYFDQAQATNPMPYRELGLYRAVLAVARYDPAFRSLTGDAGQKLLLTVPRDPIQAIAEGLAEIGVHKGKEHDLLAGLVARLPGWSGHIRWRSEHADRHICDNAPADMSDLLALWMLFERAGTTVPRSTAVSSVGDAEMRKLCTFFGLQELQGPAQERLEEIAAMTEADLGGIFMTAAEWTYANRVVPPIEAIAASPPAQGERPDAQLVFCIDVRSEPFRRALEGEGNFETIGYAGFFGLPIALHRKGTAGRQKLLPALLEPQYDILEVPIVGCETQASKILQDEARNRLLSGLLDQLKAGAATAFATAEATGPIAAAIMAARTIAPRLADRLAQVLNPPRHDALAPSLAHDACRDAYRALSLEQKVGFASALFALTGLNPKTARLLVLSGHGGSTVNNPYASALDCGACGGHAGGSNARVMAEILNDPDVRRALADRGLAMSEDTFVLAAEHDTTTDEVMIFDRRQVPTSHHGDLVRLDKALAAAGEKNRKWRATLLEQTPEQLFTGAVHWGEVRPEWGLAGNAAFIVGPRWLTKHLDLEGRAFLHSYDWQGDDTGMALQTILTAPMVVAQWINCQYLFSTLDNERYGSGNKTTHNVVGGIGVVQGNGGDLRVGLPYQSLFKDDGTPFHVPQRLLSIVYAPIARVETLIETNAVLQRLFGNDWVKLIVIDPQTGKALRWRAGEATFPNSDPISITA